MGNDGIESGGGKMADPYTLCSLFVYPYNSPPVSTLSVQSEGQEKKKKKTNCNVFYIVFLLLFLFFSVIYIYIYM